MKFKQYPYDQLSNLNKLKSAYTECEPWLIEAGVSYETISDYESDLRENLCDLAKRLSNGSYYSMTRVRFADDDKCMLEDLVVQRAVFNAVESYFEPQFLDCSFGFRSTRDRRMAAGRLLCYRNSGDEIVVESEISNCFESLDPDLLMLLVGDRIEDERLLRLLWMWLEDGRITNGGGLIEQIGSRSPMGFLNGHTDQPLEITIKRLLSDGKLNRPHHPSVDFGAEPRSSDFKSIAKRLVREAGTFALASTVVLITSKIVEKRLNRPINPKLILLAATSVFAALKLPNAVRYIRERFSLMEEEVGHEALAVNPLSGLLINIALHEFDRAMMAAGVHLVRYGSRFVITVRDGQSARAALDLAASELSGLNLSPDLSKTRMVGFGQGGVELFGYRFHESKIAAEPVRRAMNWVTGLPDELMTTMGKIVPSASRFGERMRERISAGVQQARTIVQRS